MGKKALIVELFLRSILPPFYSFSMIERVCKKKLTTQPSDKDVLWILSNLYVNYREYGKAKQPLETLYKMEKRTRSVEMLLSRVYYNLNQYGKVKNILAKKDILLPTDYENYYLGDSLIQLHEFESAAKYLAIFVNYHKDNYLPFLKLGYSYYMHGAFDLAMEAYEAAKKLEPRNIEISRSIELCKEMMEEVQL